MIEPIRTGVLTLTAEEAQWLLEVVCVQDPCKISLGIAKALRQILKKFSDDTVRLHEVTARANANSFFIEDKGILSPVLKVIARNLEKEARQREQNFVNEIACLPAEEVKGLIKAIVEDRKRRALQ